MADEVKDVSKLRSTMLDLLEDNQRYSGENQRLRERWDELKAWLPHNDSFGDLRLNKILEKMAALDGEGSKDK